MCEGKMIREMGYEEIDVVGKTPEEFYLNPTQEIIGVTMIKHGRERKCRMKYF